MPLERLVPGQWMHLSKELRDHLAKVFDVPQSKATEIRDQEILSDGRDYNDLAVVNKEKMCLYVGSEETFARAWELTVAKAYYELHPPIGTVGQTFVDDTMKISTEDVASLQAIVDDTAHDVFIGENGEGLKKGDGLIPQFLDDVTEKEPKHGKNSKNK